LPAPPFQPPPSGTTSARKMFAIFCWAAQQAIGSAFLTRSRIAADVDRCVRAHIPGIISQNWKNRGHKGGLRDSAGLFSGLSDSQGGGISPKVSPTAGEVRGFATRLSRQGVHPGKGGGVAGIHVPKFWNCPGRVLTLSFSPEAGPSSKILQNPRSGFLVCFC